MKTKDEFKVGKHNIGWISGDFLGYFEKTFTRKPMPIFQKLPRNMTDKEIESGLVTGQCELGDILAFLENGIEEHKNGYANLFYTSSCVVSVRWLAGRREWDVSAWGRVDYRWRAGYQVFSPATDSKKLRTKTLSPSDPLSLESRVKTLENQMGVFMNWARKLVPPEL